MTPNKIIADFIKGLPEMTRRDLCFAVIAIYSPDLLSECIKDPAADTLLPAILGLVNPLDIKVRTGIAITFISHLDYYFLTRFDQFTNEVQEFIAAAGRDADHSKIQALALRYPLERAQFERARARWHELRNGSLSLQQIRDFVRTHQQLPPHSDT